MCPCDRIMVQHNTIDVQELRLNRKVLVGLVTAASQSQKLSSTLHKVWKLHNLQFYQRIGAEVPCPIRVLSFIILIVFPKVMLVFIEGLLAALCVTIDAVEVFGDRRKIEIILIIMVYGFKSPHDLLRVFHTCLWVSVGKIISPKHQDVTSFVGALVSVEVLIPGMFKRIAVSVKIVVKAQEWENVCRSPTEQICNWKTYLQDSLDHRVYEASSRIY